MEPIVVLRSDDFASLDDLSRARGAVSGPVLFRVRRDELEPVLGWLRDGDDVCSLDDPPALVAHRLRRLARAAAPAGDTLTGLPDRARFVREARAELPAALLVINLDHFKRLNDAHGHAAGDEVLRIAARRIRAASPADAAVARIGGDVFAVALPRPGDAQAIAAGVLAAFQAAPFVVDGEPLRVTASIGLVQRTTEVSYEDLLRGADGALYAAKARGRGRIVDHRDRVREARARDADLELEGFEEMTRVLADRVADVITSRGRKVFQGLRDQADIDALTGLYTRRYLDRRLGFEVAQAHEGGAGLAIGLLDVDHFGQVNKAHGWPTGDRVLAELAGRVRDALRESDWAARYGGEELCVVLAGAGEDVARRALERVAGAIRDAAFSTTDGDPLAVTVSIGCAALAAGDSAAAVIERASARLLEAKRAGRDRVV